MGDLSISPDLNRGCVSVQDRGSNAIAVFFNTFKKYTGRYQVNQKEWG